MKFKIELFTDKGGAIGTIEELNLDNVEPYMFTPAPSMTPISEKELDEITQIIRMLNETGRL